MNCSRLSDPCEAADLARYRALCLLFEILCLLLLLPACSSFLSEEPAIADSTMIDVLVAFELAHARQTLLTDLTPSDRDAIFAAHGLDRAAYEKAMRFYAEHPEAYVALYDAVLDTLNARRNRLYGTWPDSAVVIPPGLGVPTAPEMPSP